MQGCEYVAEGSGASRRDPMRILFRLRKIPLIDSGYVQSEWTFTCQATHTHAVADTRNTGNPRAHRVVAAGGSVGGKNPLVALGVEMLRGHA